MPLDCVRGPSRFHPSVDALGAYESMCTLERRLIHLHFTPVLKTYRYLNKTIGRRGRKCYTHCRANQDRLPHSLSTPLLLTYEVSFYLFYISCAVFWVLQGSKRPTRRSYLADSLSIVRLRS